MIYLPRQVSYSIGLIQVDYFSLVERNISIYDTDKEFVKESTLLWEFIYFKN